MKSSEAQYWKEAVNSEVESILNNHTWELVDLPPVNKPLGYKWIFKRKLKDDGTIDKYKARLVVKEFRQKEGLNYFDTYSPVTRITSIRLLIALAAVYDLQIHQMENWKKKFIWNNLKGLLSPDKKIKYVDLLSLCMDLNKHLNNGMQNLTR